MTRRTLQSKDRQGCRAIVIVALAVGAVLGFAAAAHGAAWLGPVNLTTPQAGTPTTFGAGQGDLAVDPAGNAIAVWQRFSPPNQYLVQASFRPAGGAFGPPQDLGIVVPGIFGLPLNTPEAAMDGQGNATVAWLASNGANTVARARSRPAGGTFGPPQDVSGAGQDADTVALAMNDAGTAALLWTRSNGANRIAQLATRPPGGAFGSAADLSAVGQNALTPQVAIGANGAIAAIWFRSNGANNIVQARVRGAGEAVFNPVQDLSAVGQSATSPDVAVDPAGRTTAVWARSNGANAIVQTSARAASGVFGGVQDLSAVGGNASSPRVAVDAQNTATAVWSRVSGSNFVQAASRPSGGSFGAAQTLSAPGASSTTPRIALDLAGNAIATWGQSEAGVQIVQASRRPAGGSFGAVEPVSPGTGTNFDPRLDIDAEGSAVLLWSRRDGAEVESPGYPQAAIFDAGPPSFTAVSVPATATTGVPVAMAGAAFDRFSPVSISWSFGDGAGAAGGSVAHAYGAAGVYTVTVVASDAAGNSAAATRTVQVVTPTTPPSPVVRRIRSTVSTSWSVLGSRTTIVRLLARQVPAGARVQVRCLGKQCPFNRKSARRRRNGTANMLAALGSKNVLRSGQTLEVRITRTGFIGKVVRFKMRSANLPRSSTLCLAVGTSKPRRRC